MRRAKTTPCPNVVVPLVAWSLGTDRAYEVACGSWSCSYCARRKRAAVALIVAEGCEAALARGDRVRLMTLTDGTGSMTVHDLYVAWNRLRTRLRKSGHLNEYAAVLETTAAGALHLHALTTGKFVPQRRLSVLAAAAGFGVVADIRAVRPGESGDTTDRRAASYVSKELAAYVSKQKTDALRSKTAARRRPLRCSRGWGMSMAEAEKLVVSAWVGEAAQAPDPGPWLLLLKREDGSVSVLGGRGDSSRVGSGPAAERAQRSPGEAKLVER